MLVFAGMRELLLSSACSSLIPSRSNSVYSTFVTLYAYSEPPPGRGKRRCMRTFIPSVAPTRRSHDAKPKIRPSTYPAPVNANMVASVPAKGLLQNGQRVRDGFKPISLPDSLLSSMSSLQKNFMHSLGWILRNGCLLLIDR